MKMRIILPILLAAALSTSLPTYAAETLPESVVIGEATQQLNITESERKALLTVAMGEAGNQGTDGMRYVISTVLNRVDDPDFPNTIEGVIYQKYQFYSGYNGVITDECVKALDAELIEQINKDVLFFCSCGYNAYGTPAFKYKDHWFSTK